MLIFNGRVEGDLQGAPTCYNNTSARPSLIDIFAGSAGLLAQAAELRVLPCLPEAPWGHAPVELVLQAAPVAQLCQEDEEEDLDLSRAATERPAALHLPSPTPSASGLTAWRPTPASCSSQPRWRSSVIWQVSLIDSDPLSAASLLEAELYEAAAAVFPPARPGPTHSGQRSSDQQRRRCQPWFDAECEAARQHIREILLADVRRAGQPTTHLAKQALREAGNRYARLRQRKAAGWQRRQGTALLQMQRSDPRRFYRQWKKRHPANPIAPAAWLRHFVNLQLRRFFKPSGPQPPADLGRAGSPDPPVDAELEADIAEAEVEGALSKLVPLAPALGR